MLPDPLGSVRLFYHIGTLVLPKPSTRADREQLLWIFRGCGSLAQGQITAGIRQPVDEYNGETTWQNCGAIMADQVEWAKQIAALAKTGIYYGKNHYDSDRYQQLLDIAAEMLAGVADVDAAQIRLILEQDDGYITPKVDVRSAVFRNGKVLLVREAIDGLWSLPGGWADIGDAPSEAVEREIREESGYEAKAVKLLAVEDRKRRHPPSVNEVYKLAFLCELIGGEPRTSAETTEVAWFGQNEIPPLSLGRVTEEQIMRWFKHWREPDMPTEFD